MHSEECRISRPEWLVFLKPSCCLLSPAPSDCSSGLLYMSPGCISNHCRRQCRCNAGMARSAALPQGSHHHERRAYFPLVTSGTGLLPNMLVGNWPFQRWAHCMATRLALLLIASFCAFRALAAALPAICTA